MLARILPAKKDQNFVCRKIMQLVKGYWSKMNIVRKFAAQVKKEEQNDKCLLLTLEPPEVLTRDILNYTVKHYLTR